MKMKKRKRIIAMFLALVLVVLLIPVTGFAETSAAEDEIMKTPAEETTVEVCEAAQTEETTVELCEAAQTEETTVEVCDAAPTEETTVEVCDAAPVEKTAAEMFEVTPIKAAQIEESNSDSETSVEGEKKTNAQLSGKTSENTQGQVEITLMNDPEPENDKITLQLPNQYVSGFAYGTVEYSTDNGSSWSELNIGTNESATEPDQQGTVRYRYGFGNLNSVKIKASWDDTSITTELWHDGAKESDVTSGMEITLSQEGTYDLSYENNQNPGPNPPPPSDHFTFILPAAYNQSFISTYGTIQYAVNVTEGIAPVYYSISDHATWNEIDHSYEIDKVINGQPVTNISLLISWNSEQWKVNLGNQAPPIQNNEPCYLGQPSTYIITYNEPEFSLTLPKQYNTQFKSEYAKVEYSTDRGETYKELDDGLKATALPQDPQGNTNYRYTFEGTQPSIMMLKVTWDESSWMVQLTPSQQQPTNGAGMQVALDDYYLQFDQPFYTVVWTYDSKSSFSQDGLVKNGVVSIEPGAGIKGSADDLGGYYIIKPGTRVNVKLKPNYGYQFLEGGLNGTPVVAGTEVSTFSFTMPKAQLHLSSLFTVASDEVNVTSKYVSSGAISGGSQVIDSGNLSLEIEDATYSTEEQAAMTKALEDSGYIASTQIDISMNLYQKVNKGTSGAAWTNKQEELAAPVTINLNLSEDELDPNADYHVVRNHNGVYEVLPATYNPSTKTVSFETDKFSDYVLAITPAKDNAKKTGTSGTEENSPKTGDATQLGLCYMILLLSGILFGLLWKRDKAIINRLR